MRVCIGDGLRAIPARGEKVAQESKDSAPTAQGQSLMMIYESQAFEQKFAPVVLNKAWGLWPSLPVQKGRAVCYVEHAHRCL